MAKTAKPAATSIDNTPRRGRPEGSPNVAAVVDVQLSRCPDCGSTARGEYMGRTVQEFAGNYNGQPYTAIVRRRCQCSDCGQMRIDRSFEFTPAGK